MFAFLQKIGKSLMFPIATLPAAALLLRLGSGDMLGAVPNEAIQYIASIMAASGNAILGNLPIIFAIGIAMGFAHDSSGGAALAGAIAHLVLVAVLGTVNEELNMGVFGGIIAGITAGLLYNKYYNVKFPEWLSFFGGRRFVPIITSITMAILASILAIVWGPIQGGIDSVGNWMIGAGSLGVGMYGFFNRLLIPVGLHHVINTVIWFDFGEFTNAAGEVVKGDIHRFLAGDPSAGHFQAGFFPIMMFGLPAACLAMYFAAKKEKRPVVGGMFFSIALTAFLTGVTEPIEFSFMFLSPVLYGIHAVLTGIALAVAYIVGFRDGFGFSAGLIDYLLNLGLADKPLLLLPLGLGFGAIYFVVFYFLIKKLDLKTPGREDDEEEDGEANAAISDDVDLRAYYTIEALGGKENIQQVDYCTTRLRLSVQDANVVDEKTLKQTGARGVMRISKTNVQVIIGTSVEFLAEAIKDRLKKGNPAPTNTQVPTAQPVVQEAVKNETTNFHDFEMPMTGDLLPLSEVPDEAFSAGLMGPGFGIRPMDGTVYAPFDGEVVMIFPTKHAIGLKSDAGLEVLIHVGLDTVKLDGKGFDLFVTDGQKIQRGDMLLKADINQIKDQVPSVITPVVFTSLMGQEITLGKSGYQRAGSTNIIAMKK
ncbi:MULTISPECIES: N-acetylglucosamine-specific PTS transporter subunit IIBC [Lysinibacillus]|uniref:PTS N-acetyl glucosamine transporter subunit IIABC n=1 Tax=Lysinibacillus fusiformis TaxID=28031 RepID=A0A2I0UYB9_9BACI|nr:MULTISPECIES: N-acetylglucosamine-specific PTS transporter subunit IIBC [Lysinibacillus]KUF35666.1 PTS N-acetyl glucosamine transporter subunit IIABC [Lysinibacillus sp. F5]PKU50952.1 PTS N-acetyl glucosamine transporter subunit IIABC [Lysinibacillus fusiformis]SCY16157.1 PTS system N-acetylglucosamine-specific IIA component, Glc family /PTS system N-acetylglucosamine-specific IIB component, Glc family /PTS system N-acetylglucosamine-specific IIC component, Glc family [Lysinibacillus sp. SG9]